MKGVILKGNRQLEVRSDLPKPTPAADEVLIRNKVAAICGTDVHFFRDSPQNLGSRTELVVGHEPCGVVEAVGSAVRQIKPGQRVTVYHHIGCGSCEHCRAGDIMLCDQHVGMSVAGRGADADYVCYPADLVLPLPDGISFVDGAFIACIGGTGFSALNKLERNERDIIAIIGLGPVGLVTGMLAKGFGSTVIGIDLVEERIELASTVGFNHVFHARQTAAVEAVLELTQARGVDAVVETSGSPQGQVQAIQMTRKKGKVVYVGAGHLEPCIAPSWIQQREITLTGSFVMPIHMYHSLLRFLIRQRITFEPVVTHRFPIEQAEAAFRLADQATTGKILFVWD